jgi:hypothetical protein
VRHAILALVLLAGPAAAAPPERPRALVDTAPPPGGRVIAVAAGGTLQRALDGAQPGDVITLEAGAVFRGPFTLPQKDGDGWIVVRGAGEARLPPAGTRVTAAHAAAMPKLGAASGPVVVQAARGAHHYRLVGLDIQPSPGAFVTSLVELGAANATSEAALPHDVVLERCVLRGDPARGSRRGVALNGVRLAVIDSYLADFKEVGADSQAIMGWNGPGPFKIANNYLEAAGENVMFGGGDPAIRDLVPGDIEIRGNHFAKPLAWRPGAPGYTGTRWSVKNLFELKNARRVLVEGNVFERVWLADQAGFAVQLTVRNQDGTAPWSTIEDVSFVGNIVRHVGSGVNVLGSDDPNRSGSMRRVLIRDNLLVDVSAARWGGHGRAFQMTDYRAGTSEVVIEHNTAIQDGPVLYADGVPHHGFVYRNNLSPKGAYGVLGSGSGEGRATLATVFPGAVFVKNVVAGAVATLYPPDNFFPASLDKIGFVNAGAGDYRLGPASPYRKAGTDGRDVGADIGALPPPAVVTPPAH